MGGTHDDGACLDVGEQIFGASTRGSPSTLLARPVDCGGSCVAGSGRMVPLDGIRVITVAICCDRQDNGDMWWCDIEGTSGGLRI
jgi:hypothetical protein